MSGRLYLDPFAFGHYPEVIVFTTSRVKWAVRSLFCLGLVIVLTYSGWYLEDVGMAFLIFFGLIATAYMVPVIKPAKLKLTSSAFEETILGNTKRYEWDRVRSFRRKWGPTPGYLGGEGLAFDYANIAPSSATKKYHTLVYREARLQAFFGIDQDDLLAFLGQYHSCVLKGFFTDQQGVVRKPKVIWSSESEQRPTDNP